jgi:excisionase family DNA binding protein
MNQNNEPTILTTREAADLLRVSPRSLQRWRAQGLLPAVSLGAQIVRFRREDVLALLSPGNRPSVFGCAIPAVAKNRRAKPCQAARRKSKLQGSLHIMQNATESSHSYDFYDSAQTRRSRKKLGEAESHKIVENVYREVLPQIESAMAKLKAEGVGPIACSNAFGDAFD